MRSSQECYNVLELDRPTNQLLDACALSWFPFNCGAVLSDLDDEQISLITPGEGNSMSSLSEVMKFTYTEDTPAHRVLDERCRHLDREHTFKLIYQYCPWMMCGCDSDNKDAPLYTAARSNVRDMATILTFEPSMVNFQDCDGETALHMCTRIEDFSVDDLDMMQATV
jgi:hypothetical protein